MYLSSSFTWQDQKLSEEGCPVDGSISIIVHGFLDTKSLWSDRLTAQYLKYRGGCCIFLNWSFYAGNLNYPQIVAVDFKGVSAALLRRLQALEADGFDPDNWILYGHSLGARMVVDAGTNFGPGRIANVDACDPAGNNFIFFKECA